MYANDIAIPILYGMTLSNALQPAFTFVPHIDGIHSLNNKSSSLDAAFNFFPLSRSYKFGSRTSLNADDGNIDDGREFEYARVRRRRGRQRYSDNDEDVDKRYNVGSDNNEVGRKRDLDLENEYYDEIEYDDDDDEYEYDDDDDDDDEDDDFEGIIPNVQLDQIDPDGSIERVSGLFRDPKFWRDTVFLLLIISAGMYDNPMDGIQMQDIDFTQFYAN